MARKHKANTDFSHFDETQFPVEAAKTSSALTINATTFPALPVPVH